LYGFDVSPDLISTITDAVLEAVAEWQRRPLVLRRDPGADP
jgi:putative transposase